MNKKWLLHIIAIMFFLIFIVLGLASVTTTYTTPSEIPPEQRYGELKVRNGQRSSWTAYITSIQVSGGGVFITAKKSHVSGEIDPLVR